MAENSILIVEDERTLRRLLEYRLGKTYRVRTAANGEEALAYVHEEAPDLIVSDIMMPKMDGFALQDALSEEKSTRAIPFIFLTAKADETSKQRGMRTGVDDYITKPFDIDQLLSRIDRLLERANVYQSQLDAKLGQDFSERLMPKRMPEEPGYDATFYNKPREYGGGDIFDWKKAGDDYFFTLGDVMGKGLQAKFYAFSFLGYVRSSLKAMMESTRSPAKLMQKINQVLVEDEVMENTFASLLLIRWNPKRHELTYANAGHCRPVLVTDNGPELITYSDMILGLKGDTEYQDSTLTIPPGAAFMAYTDGLMEQQTPDGTMLGEEGVMRCTENLHTDDAPIDRLLEQVLDASHNDRFDDDILVFWLQRNT